MAIADKNPVNEAHELDSISVSFLEELAKIKGLLDETAEKSKDDKEDDDADEEYAESYGDLKDTLKQYHEKLKAYEKIIKENISEAYGDAKPEAPKAEKEIAKENDIISPFDRGHKLGCGCPGCSAYRDFYGIRLDGVKDALSILASKTAAKKTHYEETATRPCGGKMYNHFHGERAGLRNALGGYTGRFSFSRTGY